MLRTGDPCPCCGQPIKTKDPEILELLTYLNERGVNHTAVMEYLARMEGMEMERSCGNCRNHAEQCASSGQICGPRLACWYPDSSLTPDSISERAALEIIRRSRSEKKSLRYELDRIQVSERLCYRWLSVPGCPSSYFLREMALAGYDIDYILTGVRRKGDLK